MCIRDRRGAHSGGRRGGLRSEHRAAGECIDGAEATCADRVETYPRAFDIGKVRLLRANVITGNADGGDDDRDYRPITHYPRPHSPLTACSLADRRTIARARRCTDRRPVSYTHLRAHETP